MIASRTATTAGTTMRLATTAAVRLSSRQPATAAARTMTSAASAARFGIPTRRIAIIHTTIRNQTSTATTSRRSMTSKSDRIAASVASLNVDHAIGDWKSYGGLDGYEPGKYHIQTFNKISPLGLERFPSDTYDVTNVENPHAILLRSHKLTEDDVSHTVRAIARCGAGTNNIPVSRMTELGIPVFNTPGANANAVKELVLCGMLLGSRRIQDGINHMKTLGQQGLAKEKVEKDKSMFGGREIRGKKLAVIGLGHIGSATARDAAALGMDIVGYDPGLSIESALKLPKSITLCDSIVSAVHDADYISLNIPYIKGSPSDGGTHGVIDRTVLRHCKSDAVVLNFARGELVDSESMKVLLDDGGRYITDFPDDVLWDHDNAVIMPHLGASTAEAEDSAASMAADTIRDYLETGTIRNSVNFPSASLPDRPPNSVRFTVVNRNEPGMLARITDAFAKEEINIVQQINHSRNTVAYNVLDVENVALGKNAGDLEERCFKDVQETITMLDGVLSSRVLQGVPGTGYAKNIGGQYFV